MKSFPPSPPCPPRPGVVAGVALTLGMGLLVAACGERGAAEPRWENLARGFRPRPLVEIARGWNAASAAPSRVEEAEDGRVWLETALATEAWRPHGEMEGLFRADYPREGGFLHAPPNQFRLAAGERSFTRVP